jgi:hypothetical protein
MPVSEVKELAQNLLSFPRVVSTLNKRGTKWKREQRAFAMLVKGILSS